MTLMDGFSFGIGFMGAIATWFAVALVVLSFFHIVIVNRNGDIE